MTIEQLKEKCHNKTVTFKIGDTEYYGNCLVSKANPKDGDFFSSDRVSLTDAFGTHIQLGPWLIDSILSNTNEVLIKVHTH